MKIYDQIKPYAIWFLAPLAAFYGLEFLGSVLWILQAAAALTCVTFIAAFIAGFTIELLFFLKKEKVDEFNAARLNQILPMIGWGRRAVRWLLEDVK